MRGRDEGAWRCLRESFCLRHRQLQLWVVNFRNRAGLGRRALVAVGSASASPAWEASIALATSPGRSASSCDGGRQNELFQHCVLPAETRKKRQSAAQDRGERRRLAMYVTKPDPAPCALGRKMHVLDTALLRESCISNVAQRRFEMQKMQIWSRDVQGKRRQLCSRKYLQ